MTNRQKRLIKEIARLLIQYDKNIETKSLTDILEVILFYVKWCQYANCELKEHNDSLRVEIASGVIDHEMLMENFIKEKRECDKKIKALYWKIKQLENMQT